ncbi:hypothetical protein DXG01_000217 [Tephrocybe rancida]|nr:hypothetical protein DXG01_000217 [Tephrocybe rancida]
MGYETDLVINSKGKRTYIIKSLDTATFDSSRNFFTRYRLWLLIESLKDNDPAQTPQEGRTIHWLVEEYSRRLREKSIGRFPRHVSRAEIIGIFAAHADWILAQHLASVSRNIKLLNIQKWIVFCEEVASARLKANRQSLDWGLPEGGSPNEDLWNLSRFGVNKGNKDWKAKIQSAMNPIPKRAPLVKTPRAMSPVVANLPTEFIYDSDFSEASTSSYSDSSDDEDLVIGLPRTIEFSLRRPTISDGQFKWQCPACDYVIDLLDLKAENTKVLSPADDKWIRDRAWKNPSDEHVQAVFFAMVKDHFTLHDNSQKSQQRPKSPKPGENHYQVKAEAVDMEIY